LEGLLAARPDDRAVREQLAHAYLRLDDLDSASRVLDEGLAVTPDYFPLHRLRGSVHMLGGEWEPGVVRFCDALSLKPDDPAAHSDLAYCFAQVRLFGPAIEEFREALRYRPEMVEARLHLAGLLLDRGDRDEAKRELETVLELSPQDPTAQALLKLASGKTGKPDLP
jgi:Flp pilus assembly protein TadD